MIAQQTGTRAITETLEQVVRRTVKRRTLRVIPFLDGAASVATTWHVAGRICDVAGHAGRLAYLTRHTSIPPSDWFDERKTSE